MPINNSNKISAGMILGTGIKYDFSRFKIGIRADYYLEFTKTLGMMRTSTFTFNLFFSKKFSNINRT